ncbi:hypothetical protein BT63DRAFT_82774 [Microthyrium microscopicum]|uniref:Transcription factor domain-containing protein n=1 Tax=Microthyrium microscopicum TaxID=703497 RepID=A0A6A6TZ97_9PEZI|nr:hypothetical protein BT63DRAFT_82774 [Microthyrium microscopicum]
MMLRKETFPWFIHRHANLLTDSGRDLPQALSICMSISQMFVLRTPETRHYLWETIKRENQRLFNQKDQMHAFEISASLQAQVIYLVMSLIDSSPESEEACLELMESLNSLYISAKKMLAGPMTPSELSSRSMSWKGWILAESQRRMTNLWFLIGTVICIKTGMMCDDSPSYKPIPLPALKSLWEASSESAWGFEYEATRNIQTSGLETFGDLMEAQKYRFLPSNAQRLDKWNAGVDNLGVLLTLASTIIRS